MDSVEFKINGLQYSVGSEVSSTTTLLEYLRKALELRGTKYMCMEGGCGVCMVSVVKSPGLPAEAVNSCLVSVTSCQDWEITTIEHLGNRLKGYHPLQSSLAEHNGSQCGYCSPGWIMSMYSLLKSSKPTMLEIEKTLSSNICRCTGYRPILEAFKKFASDAPDPIIIPDIEELCKKTKDTCLEKCNARDWCLVSKDSLEDNVLRIRLKDDREWIRVQTVADIFKILSEKGTKSYMLVAGNTGKGVRPIIEHPQILIDISGVPELKGYLFDQNLVVGAGTTLSNFMEILKEVSDSENFEYLRILVDHLQLVANIAVRNLGSIAGNLMLKHENNKLSSDIFLLLLAVRAKLTLVLAPGATKVVGLESFLAENMTGKLILNILIPPLTRDNRLVTYKVAARSRNAHSIVNAAFLFKYDDQDNIVQYCRIVYGGLSPNFHRARNTEKSLKGKYLFSNSTLQTALQSISNEVIVVENPPEPSAKYRKQVALGLFYKALISLCPENKVDPLYRSGGRKIHDSRPISQGSQVFETNPNLWPLNQPITKLDALVQCAGESKYAEDTHSLPREVFAAFVLSTVASGAIDSIDASEALKQRGVVAFYTAKDVPGVNAFTSTTLPFIAGTSEMLCSGNVLYCNQPIGIIVAESNAIANRAAMLVKVKYLNVRKPEVDVRINKSNPAKATLYRSVDATDRGSNVTKVIKGEYSMFSQNYFCTETLNCVASPTENGLKLIPSTQYITCDQMVTAKCLDIESSRIDIESRRVGGSFGIKLSRQTQVTTACSLVAYKLNRPCRFILPLKNVTRAIGKRMPCSTNYEVGINSDGVIQYINFDIYSDHGCSIGELAIEVIAVNYSNCYDKNKWNFKCFTVATDTPPNTWFRSPGVLEAMGTVEMIIERIAYEVGLDPLTVRLNNLDKEYHEYLTEMVNSLKTSSNYIQRRNAVDKFNTENRWRKRGLRFTLMKWFAPLPFTMNITLSVYHGDGSISIAHGGVDLGQGIHTKAIQICAYFLKVPIHKIHIKASDTTLNPNNTGTAASLTSQNVGIGVRKACEELLKRLEPIKAQMQDPTWEEIISEAYRLGVNLQANAFVEYEDYIPYNTYGVTLTEVEVDILTGQWEILRADILEDVGRSVNPAIDIGQVEGAFVMGVGYWTTEEMIYDQSSGELLTDRTWNYFVPQGTDIPQDMRVYFKKNSFNNSVILGSKAVGEPPLCMGVAVPLAMREAIVSARLDGGIPSTKWYPIDGPYTVEKICLACETKIEDFKLW